MRWLVVLLAILVSFPAAAQRLPAEGTPIKAKTDYGPVEGIVRRRTNDSLWVVDRDERLRAFNRRNIWEMSTYGTQWGRGAKRGAIAGGIVGAATLLGAVWVDTHQTGESFFPPLTVFAVPVSILGMPLIGAGIGTLFAPDGWSKPRMY
jgi:hypothetical protein